LSIEKRTKIKVGRLPAGKVTIAFEMRTPFERAAPAEVAFWINGKQAATGTIERKDPTEVGPKVGWSHNGVNRPTD
jgi:hypothetical protein